MGTTRTNGGAIGTSCSYVGTLNVVEEVEGAEAAAPYTEFTACITC